MNIRKKAGNILTHIFLMALVVMTIFPLLYTFAGSFKTNSELLAHPERFWPSEWKLDNYITAWTSPDFNVPVLLKNSIIYTVIVVVIRLVQSAVCAYVFERGDFRGKKVIFTMFTALMFINMGSITTYAYFDILSALNIPISLGGLVFIGLFSIPILYIYLVRGYIKALPREMDEAAKIDGCGFMGIFVRILLPLLKPILVTVGLLAFQATWNDYLMPAIFTTTRPEQRTLMVGLIALKSSGNAAASWNLMLSGAVIALIPVLVLFLFANRFFIDGVTAGAVKG